MMKQPWLAVDGINGLKRTIYDIGQLNSSLKIWVTEFGLDEEQIAAHGSWAHALFDAHLALKMLESDNVQCMINFSESGTYVFGNIFDDSNGFESTAGTQFIAPAEACTGCGVPATTAYTPTGKGLALSLISKAMKNCTQATNLSIIQADYTPGGVLGQIASYNPVGGQTTSVDVPLVYGWIFSNTTTNGNESIILNMSNVPETLTVILPLSVDGTECIDASPESYVYFDVSGYTSFVPCPNCTNAVTPPPVHFTSPAYNYPATNQIILPPYSITRLYHCGNNFTINAETNPVCNNLTTSVYVNGDADYSYEWSTSEHTQSIEAEAGVYTVTVTYCDNTTATKSITVNAAPAQTITFTPSSFSDLCADGVSNVVQITASLSGAGTVQYAWITANGFDGGQAGLNASITMQPTVTTTYTVYATDGNCATHASITVPVAPKAELGEDHTMCIGQDYVFDCGITNGTYYWTGPVPWTSNLATPTYQPLANEVDNFAVTVTDNNGCTTTDEITLTAVNCCNTTYSLPALTDVSALEKFIDLYPSLGSVTYAGSPTQYDLIKTLLPMNFNGTFIVNKNVSFKNCADILFDEGADIRIEPYASLQIISNTSANKLRAACNYQWKGIRVKRYGQFSTVKQVVNTYKPEINDAQYAVEADNGSTVSINNCKLLKNYTAVYIPEIAYPLSQQYSNEVDLELSNTQIECTDGVTTTMQTILHGYYQQTPVPASEAFAGMNINNWVGSIGVTGQPTKTNSFLNLNNGIVNNNCALSVVNSTFTNILNYNKYQVVSAGINSTATSGYSTLVQQGIGLTINSFYNCAWGIGVNNTSIDVKDNLMDQTTIGIFIQHAPFTQNTITGNNITSDFFGIASSENHSAKSIDLFKNDILIHGIIPGIWKFISAGIMIGESSYNQTLLTVHENHHITMDRYSWYGILFSNVNSARSLCSYINMTSPHYNVAGVSLQNSGSNEIYSNSIYGNSTASSSTEIAIHLLKSQLNNIHCNFISDTRVGYLIEGNCQMGAGISGPLFRANVIGNHYEGLHLNSVGLIADQDHSGNYWNGNYGSLSALNLNHPLNQPPSEVLKIYHSQGTAYYPNQINPTADWFKNDITTTDLNCEYIPCWIAVPIKDTIDNFDLRVVTDTLRTLDFQFETNYEAKLKLMDKLHRNPDLRSDPAYAAFYNTYFNTELGDFIRVKDTLYKFQFAFHDKRNLLFSNDTSIKAMLKQIIVLDSLMTDSANELIYRPVKTFLLKSIVGLLQKNKSIAHELDSVNNLVADYALSINDNIDPRGILIAENQKAINHIYLTHDVRNNYIYDESEKSTIIGIGIQCPFEGGDAVIEARNMILNFSDTIYWDDSTTCAAAGYYKQMQLTETLVKKAWVSPNPASEIISISFPFEKNQDYSLEIFDLISKAVLINQYINNVSVVVISIAKLSNGSYYFKIINSAHNCVGIGKFIVAK